MKFKIYSERKHAADRIKKETDKIEQTLKKLDRFTPCSVLPMLPEIIKLKDTSLMFLEYIGISERKSLLPSFLPSFVPSFLAPFLPSFLPSFKYASQVSTY